MEATVRVHRGPASSRRVLMMGHVPLGPLTEEITEFRVPPGRHVFRLDLGPFHSLPTLVHLHGGEIFSLVVREQPPAPGSTPTAGLTLRMVPDKEYDPTVAPVTGPETHLNALGRHDVRTRDLLGHP